LKIRKFNESAIGFTAGAHLASPVAAREKMWWRWTGCPFFKEGWEKHKIKARHCNARVNWRTIRDGLLQHSVVGLV
jgi:hypothetical protein